MRAVSDSHKIARRKERRQRMPPWQGQQAPLARQGDRLATMTAARDEACTRQNKTATNLQNTTGQPSQDQQAPLAHQGDWQATMTAARDAACTQQTQKNNRQQSDSAGAPTQQNAQQQQSKKTSSTTIEHRNTHTFPKIRGHTVDLQS